MLATARDTGGFFYDKVVNPFLLKTTYQDKDIQESLIRDSKLVWVIVHPEFLTNGPRTEKYRALSNLEGVKAGKISQADVAHCILTQIDSTTEAGKTPLRTY